MKFSYQTGASGARAHYEFGYSKTATIRYWTAAALLSAVLVLPATVSLYALAPQRQAAKSPVPQQKTETAPAATPAPEEVPYANTQQPFTDQLQAWLKKRSGQYGVFVGGVDGSVYAEASADKPFSSESIYKLYVAYLGYQELAKPGVNPSEIYSAGRTRLECLDLMIRTSDSPCAEKMLSQLGKASVNARLKAYGLTATSVSSFKTTARDAAKVLELVHRGVDITPTAREQLLVSLKDQKYRNGLPKGMKTSIVQNKVGFRDNVIYNDVGLVTLSDGRVVIVSALSENAGIRNIALLGAEIQRHLVR